MCTVIKKIPVGYRLGIKDQQDTEDEVNNFLATSIESRSIERYTH